MLVSYVCWVIALTLLSSNVNGAHFLSNLCTETTIGTYPYPGVYNVYFECEYGNATIYACPPGTNFDPIFMICSKRDVPYERNDCVINGLSFPHPFNCRKFILCFNSKIKIIDCKFPMVYSIEMRQCVYRNRVSACRRTSTDVNLRTDLNTHIHYSVNEILGRKRDILHELTDLDEDVEKESDSSKKEFSNEIKKDKLSIQDMNLLLRELGAPYNVVLKNYNTNITDTEKAYIESFQNLLNVFFLTSLIIQHNKTSTENFNLSLPTTNTSSPNFNVSKNVSNDLMTSTDEVRQFSDDIKIVTQPIETTLPIFSPLEQPEEQKTDNVTNSEEIQSASDFSQKRNTSALASTETSTVSKQIEDAVSNITPTVEITYNIIDLEQHSNTDKLPSTPLMSTSEIVSFSSTTSTTISDTTNTDIGSTDDKKIEEVSSVEPKVLNSRIDMIDEVASSTEHVEKIENIHVNDSAPTKVENTIVPELVTELSSSTSAESNQNPLDRIIVNYNSDVQIDQGYSKIHAVDSSGEETDDTNKVSSQHEEFSSSTTTSRSLDFATDNVESDSGSVSEVTEAEIRISNYKKVEQPTETNENLEFTTSTLITFNTESTKLKEVDKISEDIGSTLVSTQHVEITSSTIAANRIPEQTKRTTLDENASEVKTTTLLFSTSNRPSDDTEDITAQSVTPFSEQSMNIPVVHYSNANITTTAEFESTTRSDSLNIVSSAIKNHENTEALKVSQNYAVTTESLNIDSTSIEPKHISEINHQKNDETLEIVKNIVTTSASQSVSTSTRPEYISTTDNQNNDEIPTTLKHVSNFIENQRNEEISTPPTNNVLINESNIANQEIPDALNIQNERFPRNVDSEIAQVGESNDDNIRLSTSIEPPNLTKIKKYPPLIYAWRNTKSVKAISISRQRLRLNGTAQANFGYVEVKGVDDIWRGVCQPTYWTIAEADIICRELGYQNGAQKAWKGHSNRMDIPAWTATSSIQCDGNEEWVNKCRFQDETECDLQHNAVGVECLLQDATTY
ncbi:serine-rich adhesin for platelets-like isoform X2 [Chelonus insularis]|uniref:serine-rich adhesin for platelets-like isoform X2 n=1 Tax=Chelonus insularis TaxID=460826 RepID=UPI00158DE07E|nr:serine-rich adhesin for platelets-like isoform X2 [Chelonus insularis]